MCTEMEEPHDDAVCIRRRHTVPASWPRHSSTVTSPDASLLIIVDEYSSMEQRDSDYVVVLTHGTSFSKDFWKPIIEFWFRPNSGMRASKVLALDAVNHGDSALANKQYLGEQDLFAQVILVEPILFQMDEQTEQIARLAMKRRDSWASLSDVVKFFKTSRSLSTWDEGQIERYAQVGTYEVVLNGHKSYLLKTSKNQEAPFPHILESLQECKVTQSFILGRNSIVLNQNHRARLMQMTTGDFFILEDVGHLIPMENPHRLGLLLESQLSKFDRRNHHLFLVSCPPVVRLYTAQYTQIFGVYISSSRNYTDVGTGALVVLKSPTVGKSTAETSALTGVLSQKI
ncbi:hypothetical protein J3E74DRAFT_294668 [Bipolaris maydis]|nr:hypothetical protein J3E74DRAFT_296913 [Bipolaris maydis]KAJ5056327.1 hypothetical protein J3E74DRAFT_294668 [Bipolaris maydis]